MLRVAMAVVVTFIALGTAFGNGDRWPSATAQQGFLTSDTIVVPGQAALLPGGTLLFTYANAANGPSLSPDPAGFPRPDYGPPTISVRNLTAAELAASNDGTTLTLAGDGSEALLLRQSYTAPAAVGFGNGAAGSELLSGDLTPPHLNNCAPTDGQLATVSCPLDTTTNAQSSSGGMFAVDVIATTTEPATRSVDLVEGQRAMLALHSSEGSTRIVDAVDSAHAPLHATWDGSNLSLSLTDDHRISGMVFPRDSRRGAGSFSSQSFDDWGCVASGASALNCPADGETPASFVVYGELTLPLEPLTLYYSDNGGTANLRLQRAGPDAANNEQMIDALMTNGAQTFMGEGRLRAWNNTNDAQLTLALTDPTGTQLLINGVMHEANGVWGGYGYTLTPGGTAIELFWTAGDRSVARGINEQHNFPLLYLVHTKQLGGGALLTQYLNDYGDEADEVQQGFYSYIDDSVPHVGVSDESITFAAKSTLGFGFSGSLAYTFDFGDGSPEQIQILDASSIESIEEGNQVQATHTYTESGTYLITVYRIDDSGMVTFAAAEVIVDSA